MLESFIYSFNSIMPIVLLVLFGMVLRKTNFLKEDFCTIADKLVFNVALPMELFKSVGNTDFKTIFAKENMSVTLFFFVAIVLAFILCCIGVKIFMKENSQRSVFIQGAVRGNYAIFALPLAYNMFGDVGRVSASMVMPIIIIMYNFLSVIAFSIYAPREEDKKSFSEILWQIAKSTAKNPLILGIVAALLMSFVKSETGFEVPAFIMETIGDVAALAVPLSLISIGVNFDPKRLKNGLGIAFWCMIVKNIALPAVSLAIGIMMGFRGIPLAVILLSLGGPTAVSSYIMAKNLHGDAELASKILLLSTICSLGTMFGFIFILKQFAFI